MNTCVNAVAWHHRVMPGARLRPHAHPARSDLHPAAVVETVRIGTRVVVGAGSVVGPHVTLGDGVVLHPGAYVLGEVVLGDGTEVFSGAVVGKPPARSRALAHQPEPRVDP
jgi:acyl-[acyl carrier protein]--UDP-N-acetylglucosamine O-acyltransferase